MQRLPRYCYVGLYPALKKDSPLTGKPFWHVMGGDTTKAPKLLDSLVRVADGDLFLQNSNKHFASFDEALWYLADQERNHGTGNLLCS